MYASTHVCTQCARVCTQCARVCTQCARVPVGAPPAPRGTCCRPAVVYPLPVCVAPGGGRGWVGVSLSPEGGAPGVWRGWVCPWTPHSVLSTLQERGGEERGGERGGEGGGGEGRGGGGGGEGRGGEGKIIAVHVCIMVKNAAASNFILISYL